MFPLECFESAQYIADARSWATRFNIREQIGAGVAGRLPDRGVTSDLEFTESQIRILQ